MAISSNVRSTGSFLPEDYLRGKKEANANVINLILFGVVLFGVIAAFFVTNQQWTAVRAQQAEINKAYTAETAKIEQLKMLEGQKSEMMDKAEITAALIEKVPRSILMAEMINRMPERVTLADLQLKSTRVKEMVVKKSPANQPKSLATKGAAEADKTPRKEPLPKPPKIEFAITLTGFSATDTDVADYHAALKECPLLDRVELVSSQETKVEDVAMRKFRIEAQIRLSADASSMEPLQVPRLRSASSIVGGQMPKGAPPSTQR